MKYEYGTDQNIGLSEHEVQEDFVRVGWLTTAANIKLLVAVVADSDSPFDYGDRAAKLAVSTLRRRLQKSEETALDELIQKAMRAAHRALQRENETNGRSELVRVSLTLALFHEEQLYLAHNGTTRAYLLRGDRLFDLADNLGSGYAPLGSSGEAGYQPGLRQTTGLPLEADGSLQMQKGDHVVLCSDGLVQPRPGRTEPLLDVAAEMPPILQNRQTPALEAARTLVSLAVGRKAQDNVSVAVVSAPAQRNKLPLLAAAGFLILLVMASVVTGLFATGAFDPPPTPTVTPGPTATPLPTATLPPPDGGGACVNIDNLGSVRSIDNVSLGATGCVSVGSGVIVDSGEGGLLELTDGSLIALEPGSRLLFSRMDREDDPSLAILVLESGSVLIHQTGEGDTIEIWDDNDNLLGTLDKTGTLVVSRAGGMTIVSCFVGSCLYGAGNRLTVGKEVEIGQAGEDVPQSEITVERSTLWQTLCPDCFSEGE